MDLAQRLHHLRGHDHVGRNSQGAQTRTARSPPDGVRRHRHRRGTRGHGQQRDPSFGGLQIVSGPGRRPVVAGSGMDQARFVGRLVGGAHALNAPVRRVIVGPGNQVEAHVPQVLGHGRRSDQMRVSVFSLGVAREIPQIDESILQVAEGGIGVAQQAQYRLEGLVLQAGQWFRVDQVANRRQRETISHAARGRRCLGGCGRLCRLLFSFGRSLAERTCDDCCYDHGAKPQPATA